MIRSSFVALVVCTLATVVSSTLAQESPGEKIRQRPNILFVLIDDMGWMDLACQGNTRVRTPNVDRLARQGMRFTDAYASAPVCSPTRASVMTGQTPARLRITNHIPDQARFQPEGAVLASADMYDRLALEYVTIAERLQSAGYATAFMGKWHLCGSRLGDPDFYPTKQGFDINIGGNGWGGPGTFFDPYDNPQLPDRKPGEYLPDRLADEAIAFMRENRNRPFSIFLWNYTVHWPMEAPESYLAKYRGNEGRGLKDHRYGAMLEAMDDAFGRIMRQLDELGLTDNTLVVFTSDNGAYLGVADIRPLREGKGFLYEGGIRVPLIVRWPGKVKPGTLCDAPVTSADFYPTLLKAAGLPPTENHIVDGEDITPLLTQSGKLERTSVYFHYPNYAFHGDNRLGSAVRRGDYKLIKWFDDNSVELYNLANDIGERQDLARKMPKKAAALEAELEAWLKETNAAIPTRIMKDN